MASETDHEKRSQGDSEKRDDDPRSQQDSEKRDDESQDSEKRDGERDEDDGGHKGRNRILWGVLAVLVIILAIGGIIAGKSSKSATSNVNSGMRAVIVPTADSARTVVVPPCGTGAPTATTNAAAAIGTTGSTSVQLPQGSGSRIVLVPACGSTGGAATTQSGFPSSLFVTKPGTSIPSSGAASSSDSSAIADARAVQSELTLPNGTPVKTVVVPACNGQKAPPGERVLQASGSSTTAVAPSC